MDQPMRRERAPTARPQDREAVTAPTSPETGRIDSSTDPLPRLLARYRDPDHRRSIFELLITIVPFVVFWALAAFGVAHGHWIAILLTVPAAGFLVRLFLVQHDCGHGAFFRSRAANDWLGRLVGIFTLTPYDYWRRTHAVHHATAGNLDLRGMGDVRTWTVTEYRAASRWSQLGYRLYRHPAVMFGLGPAYLFVLQHRLPIGLMQDSWRPWMSTMATNAAIALTIGGLIALMGLIPFLLVEIPIMLIAASAGVWLFYVQHQFEQTSWEEKAQWTHAQASLHGSSYYDLPEPLRWLTANIGVHHVHHLNSRIPFYRMPEVLRMHPELAKIGRLTLMQSFSCVRLVLWDEHRKRLISFREMRRNTAALPSGVAS